MRTLRRTRTGAEIAPRDNTSDDGDDQTALHILETELEYDDGSRPDIGIRNAVLVGSLIWLLALVLFFTLR